MSRAEGYICLSCRAADDERSREGCTNPYWHSNPPDYQPEPAKPKRPRLPYPDDIDA